MLDKSIFHLVANEIMLSTMKLENGICYEFNHNRCFASIKIGRLEDRVAVPVFEALNEFSTIANQLMIINGICSKYTINVPDFIVDVNEFLYWMAGKRVYHDKNSISYRLILMKLLVHNLYNQGTKMNDIQTKLFHYLQVEN